MNENLQRFKTVAIVSIGIVILFVFYYCFASVRDNGGTANNIRSELTNARTEQRAISESIDEIERGLAESERTVAEVRSANQSVTESIISVENRNEDAQRIIAENRRIIAESRAILESIREK